jgi:hypothetical protein
MMAKDNSQTEELAKEIPTEFTLEQNYPNPFNPITKIKYAIPQAEHVTLKVYDILGSEVLTLVNDQRNQDFMRLILT